jgi:methylthioribose-1-phosphate isomerase
VPFFVVAPSTSFDLQLPSGAAIRSSSATAASSSSICGGLLAGGCPGSEPGLDVDAHDLVTAIVCEHGVIERPDAKTIKELLAASR